MSSKFTQPYWVGGGSADVLEQPPADCMCLPRRVSVYDGSETRARAKRREPSGNESDDAVGE